MHKVVCYIAGFILHAAIFSLCACDYNSTDTKTSAPSVSAQTDQQINANKAVKSKNFDDSILDFKELYTDEDNLADGAYQVEKRQKTLWLKDAETDADVTYVVLKRHGKIINTFEGVHYPLGNDARFALFPLLGQNTKQLIVEEAHREWQSWVVDLSAAAKIIFDSGDYPVGHSLRRNDIDGDGKYELIQSSLSFWFFGRLNNVDSPFIDIVFVYNPTLQKYVPANPQFQDFALRNIEDDIQKAQEIKAESSAPGQDGGKLGAVLKVVLSYLYAGKEQEAWSFYESEYNLPDKEEIKGTVKEAVSKDNVYKVLKK